MILTDTLEFFAQVSFGLAGVSGAVLMLARRGAKRLNSLDRARIVVLFQLTSIAFVLGILPITMQASRVGDPQNLRISSIAMSVLVGFSMLLVRRTYAKARVEYAAKITTGKRLLFFGLMSIQLVMVTIVGAGLWDTAGMAIYITGLFVLLGLAFHQFLRFVGSEDLKLGNG